MTPREARTAVAGIRAALGVGSLLAPRTTGRLFGIDPDENPALPFVARLFGIRELFMAAPVLLDPDGDHADAMTLGMLVDLVDVGAAVVGGLSGEVRLRTVVLGGGAAAGTAYIGSIASQHD